MAGTRSCVGCKDWVVDDDSSDRWQKQLSESQELLARLDELVDRVARREIAAVLSAKGAAPDGLGRFAETVAVCHAGFARSS